MNGLSNLEPDQSEFVEIDPTGRYGRVPLPPSLSLKHTPSLYIYLYLSIALLFHV